MIKKIVILLIIISITRLLISQEINEEGRKVWDSLTDDEKWESYKIAHNSYIRLKSLYSKKTNNEDILLEDLERSNEIIKKVWYPRYGLSMKVYVGLDRQLHVDVIPMLDLKCYFLRGRVFFSGGLGIKIYDEIGGGLTMALGVNF